MDIIVRKPTDREISGMKTKPVWTCDVSEFDWYYDSEETCLIIEGEVTVKYGSESVSLSASGRQHGGQRNRKLKLNEI
jgi:uncharacterized cupin superfamily protein